MSVFYLKVTYRVSKLQSITKQFHFISHFLGLHVTEVNMQELGSTLPLHLSLVGPLLENKVQFAALQFKKEMEKLEMVQGEQQWEV